MLMPLVGRLIPVLAGMRIEYTKYLLCSSIKVEDACNLLNAYNGDLDKEITARGKLATILHDFRR